MSSLWMKQVIKKNKYKPSPANKKVFVQKTLSQPNKLCKSIKGISLFISRSISGDVKGSMTIEAALLTPLFLFFFLHLAGVMEMLRLHGKLEAALWNVGNQIALYTDTFSEALETLPDAGISYVLVNNQVTAFLGKDYLEESPLVYGVAGLNYLRSEYPDEDDCVDIIVTYQVKPAISIFPSGYRRMSNRYYARAWTGYDVSESRNSVRYVYVTPQGEVWHSTPACSYIHHRVISVWAGQIGSRKNSLGKKYELCTICDDMEKGAYVFVTEAGEKYHFVKDCTAIYKDIQAIEWENAKKYRACSRCGT